MNAHFGTSNKATEKALAHREAGRLQDAERLLREVLASDPHHPANHELGVLLVRQGKARPPSRFLMLR